MKTLKYKRRQRLPSGTKAAPLMWNDNWDNGQVYGANMPGHREHEPIWDRDYDPAIYGALQNADPDLMSTFITILPADLPGTFELEFGNGVKLWEDNLKSVAIESGTLYTSDTIPKSFDTEGIEVGSEMITLVYKYNDRIQDTTTLRADVVWLEAEQGTLRVIYENNQDITFTIKGLPPEYTTLQWDLDGDGTARSGDWEDMNTPVATVKYSPAASEPGNICLPEERKDFASDDEYMANRRKEYAVTVELTGGYVLPLMFGTIRVAQGTYQGTALDGELQPGEKHDDPDVIERRQVDVAGLVALPVMDVLPPNTQPPGSIPTKFSAEWFDRFFGTDMIGTGNGIIQYCKYEEETGYGGFGVDGRGNAIKHYGVYISINAYKEGFKREDMEATALHEIAHINQAIAIATPGTNWRVLDDHFPSFDDYKQFREADGELAMLNANASWKYLEEISCFAGIPMRYPAALQIYSDLCKKTANPPVPQAVKDAAKAILQEMYVGIPFIEMKKQGYNWYVKAPE